MKTETENNKAHLNTLWFDLKASIQVAETPAIFDRFCTILYYNGLDSREIETFDPDLVVIEFDYPTRSDMQRAIALKAGHPSVPMVVITVQHSEAIAVWFFRKKFVDYLVQPVSTGEASDCLIEISKINRLRRKQQPRECAKQHSSMPVEVGRVQVGAQRLLPAIALVASSYFKQLSVSYAAEVCNMMPFKFGREFKEEFGIGFREYVVRYRIREACRLLRNPNSQVSETAYAVGFSDPAYFTKTFKRLVGTTPSQVIGRQDLEFTVTENDLYRNSSHSY